MVKRGELILSPSRCPSIIATVLLKDWEDGSITANALLFLEGSKLVVGSDIAGRSLDTVANGNVIATDTVFIELVCTETAKLAPGLPMARRESC